MERSAVAEHVHAGLEPHDIDRQSLKVIDGASWKWERKIQEALHIGMRKPRMKRDIGVERSAIWDAVLCYSHPKCQCCCFLYYHIANIVVTSFLVTPHCSFVIVVILFLCSGDLRV